MFVDFLKNSKPPTRNSQLRTETVGPHDSKINGHVGESGGGQVGQQDGGGLGERQSKVERG